MRKNKVGIIGNGFVGESQAFAFSPTCEVFVYDKNKLKSLNDLEDVLKCDFVFVCVPTPMKKNGTQDFSYIEDVFNNAKKGPIYIIKSTIIPGSTLTIQKKFPSLKIVFSPEFLTERTSKLDMLTQTRVIFGGDIKLTKICEKLFSDRFMNRNYIHTDTTTAEYIKYMNNNFFAVKVSIMNEYYRLANIIGVDWQTAMNGFAADQRIGDSHLHVPGPDGKLGFGGTCFPKDINSFINFAKEKGVNMNVLEASWKTNLEVRPEKDWEKDIGRSISKD